MAGTWALGAAVHNDDPGAMSLLLDALEAGGYRLADTATEVLPEAAADVSLPVVAALLDAGADPNATDQEGVSALRLAVRAGRDDTAARLRAFGAADDGTDIGRFIGACLSTDRRAAGQLLADHPDLPDRLTGQDRAVIVAAAASRPAGTIALMLELGFSPHTRNGSGEQPLHSAAYQGNAAVVRLLLEAGADIDARDARFDGTALAFATVGSGEQAGTPGDWTETVTLLIEAGASGHDVWVSGKPPSEEIIGLLQRLASPRTSLVTRTPTTPPRCPARSGPASSPTSPGTSKPPTVTWTSACSGRSCTRRSSGPGCAPAKSRCSTGIADCLPTGPWPPSKAWRPAATPSCLGSPWRAAPKEPGPPRRSSSTRSSPLTAPRSSVSAAIPTATARSPAP